MNARVTTLTLSAAAAAIALVSPALAADPAQPQDPQAQAAANGAITQHKATPDELKATSAQDIAQARPMPLPSVATPAEGPLDGGLSTKKLGKPIVTFGQRGTGKLSPMTVPLEESAGDQDGAVSPQEYGTTNLPYTTARVDAVSNLTSKAYPFSAAGKLYFRDGSLTYVCSASLIKRGVIVTAAHCVSSFGQKRFYTNFQFVPAKYNTTAPYGTWNGAVAYILTSYFNGTDSCAYKGVVCKNDVAVIRLAPTGTAYPGTQTGWLGYGANGYGFTPNNLAQLTQLGYPVSHDSGNIMQRTDAQGFVSGNFNGNTVWGSRQTGGSSGGPEVVNLGITGSLSTPKGSAADGNVVVGVTQWGYDNPALKEQGASQFTSGNIVALVNVACAGGNAACK